MIDRAAVHEALAGATDAKAAAEALVACLATVDGLLPSLYLERAGRLRCQAVRGYWQIRDGLPPGAGVVGRTYLTGEPSVEPDVRAAAHYLEAAPDVVSEVCVPVWLGGRVAGALNAESTRPLDPALSAELTWCATAYARRLAELGGPSDSSPAQRLVVHAARLAGLTDARRIEALVVEAARDVSGMESALLLGRGGDDGGWRPLAHAGQLAAQLAEADGAAFDVIEAFVAGGTSCYSIDQHPGERPHGSRALRAAGADGLVALPVGPPTDLRSILVVADPGPLRPATELVELLELLVVHAASCLRTADAIADLRERAARDPLTGLGHHATFHEALAVARVTDGSGVAVLIADLDGFKAVNDDKGHQAGDRILRAIASKLSGALRRGDQLFRIGGDEFAALIKVSGEAEALEAGRRLRAAAADSGPITVSIGIALPRPGESDASVLARADRALYQVKQSGRDGVALDA